MSNEDMTQILVDAIRAKLHESGEVDRYAMAREMGMETRPAEFGALWTAARDALVRARPSIDLRPTHKDKDGRGGLYRQAEPVQTLKRAGRDLAAAQRKTQRSNGKAASLDVESLPPDVQQTAKRMQAKASQIEATTQVLRRKRRFDPPPPPERKPVIGVKEFQDLIDRGARGLRASIENPNGEDK